MDAIIANNSNKKEAGLRQNQAGRFFKLIQSEDGRLNSIQVLGVICSGRTTFLQHLISRRSQLKESANVFIGYVEMVNIYTPDRFFRAVMEAIQKDVSRQAQKFFSASFEPHLKALLGTKKMLEFQEQMTTWLLPAIPAGPVGQEDFRKWIMAIYESMEFAKLLIILDGFDLILSRPQEFTIEFLDLLRSLASDGRLAWVTSSYWKLPEIEQRIGGTNKLNSPLSNIFKDTIWLGYFSNEETAAFVRSVETDGDVPVTPADAITLSDIAGPWPSMLKRVIDSWLEMRSGELPDCGPGDVKDRLLTLTPWEKGVFDQLWSNLGPEQKACLYSLVHSGQSVPKREIEDRLIQYGILKKDGRLLRITSLLFEQWIRSDAPTPIELKGSSIPSPRTRKEYEGKVFVSYAWEEKSEKTVDKLERAFKKHGINIIRDKKDLEYTGSIEEFEKRIGQGQCIVLVISDKYLRSKHCMYELMLVKENRDLPKRVFPIVLSDASIYDENKRLEYIHHWDNEIKKFNKAIKNTDELTNVRGFIEELEKSNRIRDEFDQLTSLLKDMNALTPEIHEKKGFTTLINAVEKILVGN
jgi:hypothetical protein